METLENIQLRRQLIVSEIQSTITAGNMATCRQVCWRSSLQTTGNGSNTKQSPECRKPQSLPYSDIAHFDSLKMHTINPQTKQVVIRDKMNHVSTHSKPYIRIISGLRKQEDQEFKGSLIYMCGQGLLGLLETLFLPHPNKHKRRQSCKMKKEDQMGPTENCSIVNLSQDILIVTLNTNDFHISK